MKIKFKRLSFLCATLLLNKALLFSADALLVRVSGNVEVLTGKSKGLQSASAGMGLKFGDTVQTSKEAKAQILFSNGNAILIKESTTLKISGKPGAVLARIPYGKRPRKIEPADVPIDYLDTFAVDGSIEGFKEMLEQK